MLFDKNGFYMIDESSKDYDFAIDIINGNAPRDRFYNLREALTKGNLFPDMYRAYKSYRPRELSVTSGRDKMLLEIQELDFAVCDLNLYLDLHPNDDFAFKVFKSYVEEEKKKIKEYTRIYGPLMLENTTDEYEWSKGVWPWEEGGM